MKLRYLILLAVVVFLGSLAAYLPAPSAYGWLRSAAPALPLEVYDLSGTVFEGRAETAQWNGQTAATGLRWDLSAWRLPLLQARYHLQTSGAPVLLDGNVTLSPGGVRVQDLRANSDVKSLGALSGQRFVPFNGQVALDLGELRLKDQWPVSAEGRVEVVGLQWALGTQATPLGNYQADLQTEGDDIVALISTVSGSVEVNGDARLKSDRSYEYNLQLRPSADAPQNVVNMLKSMGRPDAQGYYQLRSAGQAAQ